MSTSSPNLPSAASPRRRRTLAVRAWSAGLLALAVGGVAFQPPAFAAPAAPVITGPSGTVSNPEVSWRSVSGAASYEVQVDNNSTFSSPEWKSTTVNTISVPTSPLTGGAQYVRVRAKSGSTWGPWAQRSFQVASVPAPALASPISGVKLAQPDEPPLLAWSPVAGATHYTVEVDTDSDFVGAKVYDKVASTSFVVPDNQAPDITYHWRVRATLGTGIYTAWSESRMFTVLPLAAPKVTGPGNDVDVTDVVLDWEPVTGATHYELQVDDDYDFNSPEKGIPARILGTRFSPPTTFGNDQYYWRVRAVDADGNPTAWVRLPDGQHYEFDRVWRDRPQLVHPVGSTPSVTASKVVGDDLYYEWTPVPQASHYEVWLSTDPNFSYPSDVTWKCQVVGTTYTPGERGDDCMPTGEGLVHYWKVRALDLPYSGGVEGIFSEAQAFVYEDSTHGAPGEVWEFDDSAAGKTVQFPTADWEPVDNTAKYRIELVQGGSVVQKAETQSTSWTPPNKVDPSKGPFWWQITGFDHSGHPTRTVETDWSFNVASEVTGSATPLTPIDQPATYDAPNLRWGALADADHYRLWVRNVNSTAWFNDKYAPLTKNSWSYPAATDNEEKFLNEGTYEWFVEAYDKVGTLIDSGRRDRTSTFTVLPLTPVTGQRIALTGKALDQATACSKSLTAGATNWCDAVPSTPVLDWSPVKYAGFYRVHVSRDADFTTGTLTDSPPETSNTRWAPRWNYKARALPDSQASTAYHWFIQPCKTKDACGPDPRSAISLAKHAFRKASPVVELLSPTHVSDPINPSSVVSTSEITFDWKDYFTTNRATTYAETGEQSYQSGQTYRLEVSTDPTFASTIESVVVDQPTYTAAGRLYPEGTLYWRVQVNDGGGNRLTWSETRTLVKRSAAPVLRSPAHTARTDSSTPFRWSAQAFADSYEIQVAANGDVNFSRTNLVVDKTSKRPAFTAGYGTKTLPSSPRPYVWRVRRVDSVGNKGPWSNVSQFVVGSDNPELVAPATTAKVGVTSAAFRWKAAPRAARSLVSYRVKGAAATKSVTTSATSFAPTETLLPKTTYEWKVQALSGDGQVIGESAWRTFTTTGKAAAKASKTSLTVKKKVRTGKKKSVKLTVTVKVTAKGAKPRGTVKVYAGKKVVGKATLKSNGKVKFKTKALKRGTHKIKVTYLGKGSVKKSTSKTVKVKIVR